MTIKFTLDSGASDVLIPAELLVTLIRSGTLSEKDVIGNKSYSLADGSTLQSNLITLREVRVGNQILRNVIAAIGPPLSTPLLGQSFLSHLGSWTIDNQRHMLVFGSVPGNPATSPKELTWRSLGKDRYVDFQNQCLAVAKAAALRSHKHYCIEDMQEFQGPEGYMLLLEGKGLVIDVDEKDSAVDTQEISYACSLNQSGQVKLGWMSNSGLPFMNVWRTLNNCIQGFNRAP